MRENIKKNAAIERKSERKQKSFYAKMSEIKRAMFTNQSIIALLYKEAFFSTNDIDSVLPSLVISLTRI